MWPFKAMSHTTWPIGSRKPHWCLWLCLMDPEFESISWIGKIWPSLALCDVTGQRIWFKLGVQVGDGKALPPSFLYFPWHLRFPRSQGASDRTPKAVVMAKRGLGGAGLIIIRNNTFNILKSIQIPTTAHGSNYSNWTSPELSMESYAMVKK